MKTQRLKSAIGWGFVIVVISLVPIMMYAYHYVINIRIPGNFSDFSTLWHTTDAISAFVQEHKKWPDSWEEMAVTIEKTNEGYGNLPSVHPQTRIEINFHPRHITKDEDDWLVRVKSGFIVGEQEAANERLRPLWKKTFEGTPAGY